MKRYTKGFTLIELLVVIAIIGILASVVLVSLQSARKKGNDTRVISSVQQIRTLLEANYTNGSYPDLTGATRLNPPATVAGTMKTLQDDIIGQQSAGGLTGVHAATGAGVWQAGTFVIAKTADNPGKGYAIYAKLPSDSTKAFCIDSQGATKTTTNFPGALPADDTAASNCQ